MKHAKPSLSRPNWRVYLVAALAVGFIATFFGIFNATARDSATPASQQVVGRVETCKLTTSSTCVINHGLGVKPTAVVATPAGPGQNITIDVSKVTATSYTVLALWHDGKKFTTQPTIKFNVVYTYVGTPVTPSPTPTVTSPTQSPTPTVTPTPTSPPTTPADPATQIDYTCDPTNTVAHFYPSGTNTTGNGSDSIGDPYNASAEHWAVNGDFRSNMCVYSKDKWYVEAKSVNDGGMVQAYPSMRLIYHDWGSDSFANDPKLSSFPQLKVEFGHVNPANCTGCIYNDAFDIWLNGIGNGDDVTELMIWTKNQGQSPYGDPYAEGLSVAGYTWDVYYGAPGYVALIPVGGQEINNTTLDIKAIIKRVGDLNLITKNPSDPQVSQVSYGVEIVSTGKNASGTPLFRRWDFTKFNVLDK